MDATAQVRQEVLAAQDHVASMKVWRRRLPTDDGYEFCAATCKPGSDWHPARREQIVTIACRALAGV